MVSKSGLLLSFIYGRGKSKKNNKAIPSVRHLHKEFFFYAKEPHFQI